MVSPPLDPFLEAPTSLKPLVEFTKFGFTRALLSLQKQVLLERLMLGGNGQGSVLPRQDRGAFCSQVSGCKGILVQRGRNLN